MLNKVILMGRLTADPNRSIIHTVNGEIPKATFSLAVEDDFRSGDKKTTHFIKCSCWRKTADFASAHFHKGDMMSVVGKLITWTDGKGLEVHPDDDDIIEIADEFNLHESVALKIFDKVLQLVNHQIGRRTVTEVSVDNIYFTGSKSREEDSQEVPVEYDDQDLPWD